jgi:hypothetical protein
MGIWKVQKIFLCDLDPNYHPFGGLIKKLNHGTSLFLQLDLWKSIQVF